jgi:hypothetical protein
MILSYLGTGVFLHLAYERYYWFMIGLAAAAVGILREELALIRDTEPLEPVAASGPRLVPTSAGGAYVC